MPKEFIIYTHNQPEVTTVGDFVQQQVDTSVIVKDITATELLNYKNNRSLVRKKLTPEQRSNLSRGQYTDQTLPLNVNTTLKLPNEKLRKEVLYTQSTNVIDNSDRSAFVSSQVQDLFNDVNYERSAKPVKGSFSKAKKSLPHITVWMWCRALGDKFDAAAYQDGRQDYGDLQGGFINITPFVQDVTTNVGDNGGNFQLTVTPITAEFNDNGWSIKKSSMLNFNASSLRGNYNAKDNTHKIVNGELKRNNFLFHDLIQSNDLIYIRFETLEAEKEDRIKQEQILFPSSKDVAGNIYDMIGMVDQNSISYTASDNNIGINIGGRDLMKTLLDDGAYFFPLTITNGKTKLIGETSRSKSNLIRRSNIDGSLPILDAYVYRSILFSLQFVINQLSNTGYVPDEVFSGYEQRNQKFRVEGNEEVSRERMRGVWQIIDLLVDEGVSDRRIVDSSISTEQGSLINFVRRICQEPFVKFTGDTFGDRYVFAAYQPSLDEKKCRSLVFGNAIDENEDVQNVTNPSREFSNYVIDIEEEDLLNENLQFNDQEVYSWYQLSPTGLFFGEGGQYATTYLPVIWLEDYGKVWGNKPYKTQINYMPYNNYGDANKQEQQNYLEKQSFYDLKYIIDSNCYLPFTRKGAITINGDRRIKRGMLIHLKSTGEIFFVDNVQQYYGINQTSVDRTTTLQVSRGMIKDYIRPKAVEGIENQVSYFNIVRTPINEELIQEIESGQAQSKALDANTVLADWGINKDVFNFFLQRRQFA